MIGLEPDAVVRRQEALLAARLRMQEELNEQAEKFKEKQKKVMLFREYKHPILSWPFMYSFPPAGKKNW